MGLFVSVFFGAQFSRSIAVFFYHHHHVRDPLICHETPQWEELVEQEAASHRQ